ncbi:hypothetical protein Cgig2_014762 [Carnegiea gigantea]|uniref:U6 small nuclear RNA (adenine-(43)-N(6))-methyltransferase n=1 Tax=Carnegiea gigantea TaxID=171969 RepID=A0A9Q1QSY8_9CARY|nr:hypothetical protein Cgig2_014762 [Carnegiea gigantea]
MPSKKRKRGERPSIHPRNRYADNPPDFSLLASLYPSFSQFVFYSKDGRPRIDWTDFNATRELTRVLLHHDHGLNWWIPDGQLCPTVPNRSNYIHWIEDLLASDIIEKIEANGGKVRAFDIGTGANCIYPLLGASLLGWSFVGSDVTEVALEWAEKNVKSNPHISELIEIRRVDVSDTASSSGIVESSGGNRTEDSSQGQCDVVELASLEMKDFCDFGVTCKGETDKNQRRYNEAKHSNVDEGNQGPPILLGVLKEGEKFDFCMCNPPFFESMEEAGLNPKTCCGGTPEEMVCQGGERAFISRIIEDSATLKQSFRWYTSMVGRKSNLKFLMSKLREVGVTIVKTTEFVQGQTCRWGLAWSFMPTAKRLVPSHAAEKSNLSFMLEGLHRQTSAFYVLQSIESFFCHFGASCKSNPSSFTVDVSVSSDHCDAILKSDVEKLDEASSHTCVAESSSSASLPTDTGYTPGKRVTPTEGQSTVRSILICVSAVGKIPEAQVLQRERPAI